MSEPIHLCIVGITWPPETFIARKLHGLANAGFTIDVPIERAALQLSGHPNIRLKQIPDVRGSALLPALANLSQQAVLSRDRLRETWLAAKSATQSKKHALKLLASVLPILNAKPDIIHFEWNSAAITYLPFYDLFGCPIVISSRGSQVQIAPHNPRRSELKAGLAETFSRAAAVHCVSEAIKQEATLYALNPDKAWVIRPAVDPDFFRPLPGDKPKNGVFGIVSTGGLSWVKGYEYALLAIRALVDQGIDVEYKIIGEGPERQRLMFTIGDLNLHRHVQLLGKQTPEQVRDHLQQADAFLLPSLSEGISNAALEGMGCGLAIVITDCGGMSEAVSDGVEGLLVPPRDPDAMGQALAKLACDPNLRHEMGMAGRRRILEQFTLEQQIAQFKALYASLTQLSH